MSSGGNKPVRPMSLGNVGHIRVYVRPRDVPRWNRIFEKSGKNSNPALLEWMMQLAEEKLNLNADQSRLEWSQEMKKIENGVFHSGSSPDDDAASEIGDFPDLGETDHGQATGTYQNGSLTDSPPNVHDREFMTTAVRNVNGNSAKSMWTNNLDHVRENGAEPVKRLMSVVDVMDEQITVEKKGSNAPIRKRFRLRASPATHANEVPRVSEATPQTFREPLKVRRKMEKSGSGVTAPVQSRTLRSREKTVSSAGGQPKLNNKVTPNSDCVTVDEELRMTFSHDEIPAPSNTEPMPCPPTLPPRTTRQSSRKTELKNSDEPQTFTCAHCPRIFKNATSHSRHEKVHNKTTRHACDMCEKKFATRASLWHHKKLQHEEKHLKCPQCDQRFSVQRFLNLHMRKHTGERPFRCKHCDTAFSLRSTLRNHELTHQAVKHFLCDTCGQSFRRKDNLEQHVTRRHKTHELYKCNICGKTFNVKSSLTNHQIHHQNKENGQAPYKCDLCEKHFTTPNGLKHHKSLHKMRKDHICETCGKVFKMKYYLTKHQAVHLKVKPFPCSLCDRGFTQKSNLDIHMRTHTGDKPYVCKVCGKAFAHNVSLKSHTASCHSDSASAPSRTKNDAKAPADRQSPKKKFRRMTTPPEMNPIPNIEINDNSNVNVGLEGAAINSPTTVEEAAVMTLKGLAEGGLPLMESNVLEGSLERKYSIPESDNLVIDEQQYSHGDELPNLNNSLSATSDDNQRDVVVVGIPEDISYNLSGFLPSTHATAEKAQYVSSSLVNRQVPQTLPSSQPDNATNQSNHLEVPPSPNPQLDHLVQSNIRGYTPHHLHPGNSYVRQPMGSPALNQAASPIIHQDGVLPQRTIDLPPPEQNRLAQPLSTMAAHENLSPQMVPQNDSVSPLPLPVDNTLHQQVQPAAYPQNINFIPTFHPQGQPLALATQSSPLLPNMIRKDQLLVEGLPQNFMIPFRAIAPGTATQMVQDQRVNDSLGNLQQPSQPVHLPFRYIEYSQSLGEPAQQSPHDRPENLSAPASHFSKAQTNLPPSRMTPSLQGFSYNTNFAAAVSTASLEQARATPSFGNPAGQRSPAFVNHGQMDNINKEAGDAGGLTQGGETSGGQWKQTDVRWEMTPHLHQISPGQGSLGRDVNNMPPQLRRQIAEYSRKIIPFHAVVSSQSQQPVWEPSSS